MNFFLYLCRDFFVTLNKGNLIYPDKTQAIIYKWIG